MKIDTISLYHVEMPLISPFRTSFSNEESIESVVVKISSGNAYGWGEAAPWRLPAYSGECASCVFMVIKDILGPSILGKDIDSGERLQSEMAYVKDNYFAKSALDLAWWDLKAKLEEKPLWKLIGGTKNPVDVGADFGVMETIPGLLDTIDEAVQGGFKRIKLKYRPGWDLEMVRKVRERFPNTVFHVDCNSAYTLADVDMFKELDRYNLAMIEQPLMHNDLIDHASLQGVLLTPLCLDESITSLVKARQAIEIGACGWVNIKVGRVGGLTNAIAIHDHCQEYDIPCWVGGMLESALGAHHCIALATLPNFLYPNDIFPSSRFYKRDIAEPEVELSGPSQVTAPDTPGCGAEPNKEMLEKLTLQHHSISE